MNFKSNNEHKVTNSQENSRKIMKKKSNFYKNKRQSRNFTIIELI